MEKNMENEMETVKEPRFLLRYFPISIIQNTEPFFLLRMNKKQRKDVKSNAQERCSLRAQTQSCALDQVQTKRLEICSDLHR